MSTQDEDDRREYYRIADTIALEFTLLPDARSPLQGEPASDDTPLFNLLNELHSLDVEAQHLLRHIAERDRLLASYLKVVNRRTELIGQALVRSMLGEVGSQHRVTLSENGLGFESPRPFPIGSHLALKMVLMPQAVGLLLRAQVTRCQALDDGRYAIGTVFEPLTDAQRQLLARHILQRQAFARRQARQQPE